MRKENFIFYYVNLVILFLSGIGCFFCKLEKCKFRMVVLEFFGEDEM